MIHHAATSPDEWTPELVEARLVEAIEVIVRTTKRPGPKRPGGSHPALALTEAERWQSIMGELETLWSEGDYKGQSSIELFLRRVEAAARHQATAHELEQATEAASWIMRYLAGDPLQADALRTWAFCRATGRSIERTLEERRDFADWMIERNEAQERVRRARCSTDPDRGELLARARAASPYERNVAAMRKIIAERAEWVNARISERNAELAETLARLPAKGRTVEGAKRADEKREKAEAKARSYCNRVKRSALVLAKREALASGAVTAKPKLLGLKRKDVLPDRVLSDRWLTVKRHEAARAIADALNRDREAIGHGGDERDLHQGQQAVHEPAQ